MNSEQTCGKGLAENAILPATLANVVQTLADVLTAHTAALDPTNADARREREVYHAIAGAHGRIANELRQVARQMEAARDLPAAPHDMRLMTSAPPRDAFAAFVAAEEALSHVLTGNLERDRAMLAAW